MYYFYAGTFRVSIKVLFFCVYKNDEIFFFYCSLVENLWPHFQVENQIVSSSEKLEDLELPGPKKDSQIYVDITTSFTMLIGLFFPSVTGWCFFSSCLSPSFVKLHC